LLKIRERFLVISFLLIFTGLSACSSNQELNPKIELKQVRAIRVSSEFIELEGVLEIYNPNDTGRRFSGYKYTLEVEGQRLITGESNRPFEIQAQKKSVISLPATIRFNDLSALGKKDLFGRDISYLFSGTVQANSWFGTFPIPFSYQGTFNLSELLREKILEFMERASSGKLLR
jgi:LEA14-like dessication related protein